MTRLFHPIAERGDQPSREARHGRFAELYPRKHLGCALPGYDPLHGSVGLLHRIDRDQAAALPALVLAFSAVILLIADLDRPGEGLLKVSQQTMVDFRNRLSAPQP